MAWLFRSALLLICGVSLAACGASDFAKPVTAFSDTTTQAATSFKNSRESVEKFANERRLRLLAEGGMLQPATLDKDCVAGAHQCRLVINKSGVKKPAIVALNNLQRLMDELDAYARGLTDIVKADTTSDVNKATDALKSNLTGLSQHADELAKQHNVNVSFARATPFISPAADAANYVISKALEAQKIAALRQATSDMEDMFPTLAKVFDAVNTAARIDQMDQINAAFKKAQAAYLTNRNEANGEAYMRAAAAYHAALNSNPKNVFEALREAHTTLAQSLKSPNPSFTDLWAYLQKATEEANKLAEINKAFQNARATASKQS
ncbi:MAG: hypothetical protein HY848_20185 [Betaproteobacteria bacterium]|nr:hypothetical protein [Betaproteobacteria bacterium]